jgi:hypothetical protein
VKPTCSRVRATERKRRRCGSSSNIDILEGVITSRSASGGGVRGRVGSTHLLLLMGSSVPPSSPCEGGVLLFSDIGAMVEDMPWRSLVRYLDASRDCVEIEVRASSS